MGLPEKLWDAFTTIIRMNGKVEDMAEAMKAQQEKIEDLTMRVVRLETALELALAAQGRRPAERLIARMDEEG